MEKGTKIALTITGILALAGGGFFLYRMMTKKRLEVLDLDVLKSPAPSIDLAKGQKASENTIAQVGGSTSSAIPFQNKDEGNLFRSWVNDHFSTYAQEIDLDRTGSYNNSFITKAWAKLGKLYAYKSVDKNTIAQAKTTGGIAGAAANLYSETKQGIKPYIRQIIGMGDKSVPTGPYSTEASAMALRNSMKGWGTNDDQFFNTMTKLTPVQRIEVENYFNKGNLGEGATLEEWIRGDFSGTDLKRALAYIQ